jgi:modulator of FtsH protease
LAAQRNRVLRNTYALLALTLVPTVLGAWIGIASGFNQLFAGRIWLSLLVFFGGAFAFIWGIERNKNNAFGVVLLLAFTFFMGLMLSRLSGMGKFLFVGALVVMIGGIAGAFLQMPALTITLLVLCLGIFSAYMLYDINQIVTGGETNYISATLALYLDIFNVFQSLLSLLGIFGGNSD